MLTPEYRCDDGQYVLSIIIIELILVQNQHFSLQEFITESIPTKVAPGLDFLNPKFFERSIVTSMCKWNIRP